MKFFVGGRYIGQSGFSVRTIVELRGDDVYWSDKIGAGKCSVATFKKWAATLAPDSPAPPMIVLPPKHISKQCMTKALKEVAEILKLRLVISGFQNETTDANRKTLIGVGLWQLNMGLQMLADAEKYYARREKNAAIMTRLETQAKIVQGAISCLLDAMNASRGEDASGEPLSAAEQKLGESLAYGSLQIAQFQSGLVPYLDR